MRELELLAHLSTLTDDEAWIIIQNLHHTDRALISTIRGIVTDNPNLPTRKITWKGEK